SVTACGDGSRVPTMGGPQSADLCCRYLQGGIPTPHRPMRRNRSRRRTQNRWRSRPLLSLAMRAGTVLVPAGAGVATGVGIGKVVPPPHGLMIVAWWAGIFLSCTVAGALVERLARRVLPLATLLRLSL